MSSKFPLVVILTEVAAQLQMRSWDLSLEWVPRNQNEEADALTNEDFSGFRSDLRIVPDLGELPWQVLPRMVAVAEDLFARVQAAKVEAAAGAAGPPPE
eukprot:4574878-Lingulodinium_polyedra.AAC.1